MERLPERFRSKIDVIDMGFDTPCWIWTASRHAKGYGTFRWQGKIVKAHRFAYAMLVGTLPDSVQLHHKCEREECANPWHCEPVEDNYAHKQKHLKTHCKRGHELAGDNLLCHKTTGKCQCRECHRITTAEYRATHREELRAYFRERAKLKKGRP